MYKRIFLDTNPIIYLVENQQPYADKVLDFIVQGLDDKSEFYTSTITDAEFLVKPYSKNDLQSIELYREFLSKIGVLKCFVTEQIAEKAAKIRTKYPSIKLGDSIQLAASMDCECDCFYTNDSQLNQVTEANVVYLDQI